MNPKLKRASWFLFGIFCLLFFTVLKIPRAPIKDSLHSMIADVLESQGATFSATEEHLSFFLSPSYQLKNVTLNFPPPASPGHLDQISLSPSFLPLFLGRLGGNAKIHDGKGFLKTSFANRKTFLSLSFDAEQMDLARLGVLPLFLGIQGTSVLDGSGSVSTDFQAFNQTDGKIDLQLSKLVLEPQLISGFAIPKLNISEAKLQASITGGKINFKSLKIGKTTTPGSPATDDISATITGEIQLGKTIESSTLNLKTHFKFSDNLIKSFMLIDALLGAGKQADGSYSFSLTGSIMNPIPQPLPQNGGSS